MFPAEVKYMMQQLPTVVGLCKFRKYFHNFVCFPRDSLNHEREEFQ